MLVPDVIPPTPAFGWATKKRQAQIALEMLPPALPTHLSSFFTVTAAVFPNGDYGIGSSGYREPAVSVWRPVPYTPQHGNFSALLAN